MSVNEIMAIIIVSQEEEAARKAAEAEASRKAAEEDPTRKAAEAEAARKAALEFGFGAQSSAFLLLADGSGDGDPPKEEETPSDGDLEFVGTAVAKLQREFRVKLIKKSLTEVQRWKDLARDEKKMRMVVTIQSAVRAHHERKGVIATARVLKPNTSGLVKDPAKTVQQLHSIRKMARVSSAPAINVSGLQRGFSSVSAATPSRARTVRGRNVSEDEVDALMWAAASKKLARKQHWRKCPSCPTGFAQHRTPDGQGQCEVHAQAPPHPPRARPRRRAALRAGGVHPISHKPRHHPPRPAPTGVRCAVRLGEHFARRPRREPPAADEGGAVALPGAQVVRRGHLRHRPREALLVPLALARAIGVRERPARGLANVYRRAAGPLHACAHGEGRNAAAEAGE